MNSVFELVYSDCEKVVLKVNASDNLTIAMHPYISSDYDYITVTRGNKNHVLTIIKKDGSTVNFNWGDHGCTCISEGLSKLKTKVLEFISDSNIVLDATCLQATRAIAYYNDNLHRWQCVFKGVDNEEFIFWSKSVKNKDEMLEKISMLDVKIPKGNWLDTKSKFGFPLWEFVPED